jgi:hypothetical protein
LGLKGYFPHWLTRAPLSGAGQGAPQQLTIISHPDVIANNALARSRMPVSGAAVMT